LLVEIWLNMFITGDTKKSVNGFSSSLLLCLLYVMGGKLGLYRDDLLFIHFSSVITCFAVICVTMYGIMLINYRFGDYYNVTTISEFCFGVELHPTILDIDVKHFVRSCITLVIWPLFIISSLYYQRNMQGKITSEQLEVSFTPFEYFFHWNISESLMGCSLVQMSYILKYHWNEYLALNSLDYKRSNCGIYKLWSDMVLFPILYCSPISIIAQSQRSISLITSVVLTAIALFFMRSKGKMKIGGLDPFFITAKYKSEQGETSANLLLGSGYWSKSRHPNYLCEAATFLTFSAFQGPYVPVVCHFPAIFITGYLISRVWLDESRCVAKYGQSWLQYCNKVPFRMFPGFY
uniref:7-dehydrocholesterol reductase n=1 Tax=Angiostrongylus cantonensis TaxID=6313 RepID=A0A0K0DJ07_ANGCA